ncbi:MAG: hypothetical protein H0W25_15630 [Acidimicrobiia bacterium]|nr:hypothetical protein [Acidimicrobiia bacterium]
MRAQIAEQLRERTARYGIDTWTVFAERPGVTDQTLPTTGPVIEALRA